MAQNLQADLDITPLVFVYGTLKKGYGNNVLLRSSEYLGEATTMDLCRLYDGSFPYMEFSFSADAHNVEGEVYKVDTDTLANLDILEGVEACHYRRKGCYVTLDGVLTYVWTYVAHESIDLSNRKLCELTEQGTYKWV